MTDITSTPIPTKITIENYHYATLAAEPGIHKLLDKFLSFKEEGIEFSPKFRNSNWDGVTHLLNKNGKFSLGLVHKIEEFCAEQEIPLEIVDKRKIVPKNQPLDLIPVLTKQGRTPRDYQLDTVKAAIDSGGRGVCRLATSAGKSIIISLLTAEYNTTTIIYVIGLDLLNQFHKDMSALFPEEIGYIGNGVVNIKRINVASIWTLGSALDINKKDLLLEDGQIEELPTNQADKIKINKMLKETQLHIIDECHVSSCSTIQTIYKNITPTYLFGFSGTPFKGTDNDLLTSSILGKQLININASTLIRRGVIAKPFIKFVNVPNMGNQGTTYQEIYKNYVVENDMRNGLIIAETKKLIDKKYTVLVLFKSIKHGEILKEKFLEAGMNPEVLSGKDDLDKRDIVKAKIFAGECNLILASTIFDIGLDVPPLSALVLTGSGKGFVKALQRVGRVIRGYTSPEGHKKTSAAVVEFYDNCKYLKAHSVRRYNIYKTEEEFKIIPCESMKKFI